jgi:hypothetical protein
VKKLPPEVRARLGHILDDAELAAIVAADEPPFIEAQVFLTDENLATLTRLKAALTAVQAIVEVAEGLDWPVIDRRKLVSTWQDQVLTELPVDAETFVLVLRKQPWWRTFQERLRHAGRTRMPARAVATFGQQLKQVMTEARISVEWLVDEVPLTQRTIERLRADERSPQIGTVRVLEAALTKALGSVPFRFQFPVTSRSRRRKRHSRKRSQ